MLSNRNYLAILVEAAGIEPASDIVTIQFY